MRNLKRALSLGLTAAMISGLMVMGSSAVSYPDSDQIQNQTAVEILGEIGVMVGDDNGNFNPTQDVTRAEMAVIITRILYGNDLNVDQFKGMNLFTDVPAWAEGFVNLCASLDIVAGVGDGKFAPNETVTAAQAALMLSRALGYFQNNAEFGNDWALAAIRRATSAGIIGDDMVLAANEGLSRDNVAQMTFNTLTKAVPVQYNELLNVYYNENQGITYALTFNYLQTLGYTNFDLVYDNGDTTIYGRPATTWGIGSYRTTTTDKDSGSRYDEALDANGGLISSNVQILSRDEIITIANEPTYTYTDVTSQEDIYDDLGAVICNGDRDNDNDYTWTVYTNGEEVFTGEDNNDSNNDNNYVVEDVDVDYRATGKGAQTEIYVDDADHTVTVVEINYYLGQIASVHENDSTVSVRPVSDLDEDDNAKLDDFDFATTEFAEDDYVVFTIDQNADDDFYICEMMAPETVTGTVTRVNNNSGSDSAYLYLDRETRYNYSAVGHIAYDLNDENNAAIHPELEEEYTLYLDPNGYVLAYSSDAVQSFLYVQDSDEYLADWEARVVLSDGTDDVVRVDDDVKGAADVAWLTAGQFYALTNREDNTSAFDFNPMDSEDPNHWWLDPAELGSFEITEDANGDLVAVNGQPVNYHSDRLQTEVSNIDYQIWEYETNADGDLYTLTGRDTRYAYNVEINNGQSYVDGTGDVDDIVINQNTIFVDVENNTVYTGYDEVPDVSNASIAYLVENDETNSRDVAEIIYIIDGDIYDADAIYFVITSEARDTERYDGDNYFEFADMYVDGDERDNLFISYEALINANVTPTLDPNDRDADNDSATDRELLDNMVGKVFKVLKSEDGTYVTEIELMNNWNYVDVATSSNLNLYEGGLFWANPSRNGEKYTTNSDTLYVVIEEQYNRSVTELTDWRVTTGGYGDIEEDMNTDHAGYMTAAQVLKDDEGKAQLVYIWKFNPEYRYRDITVTVNGTEYAIDPATYWWSYNYVDVSDAINAFEEKQAETTVTDYSYTYTYTVDGKTSNAADVTVNAGEYIAEIASTHEDVLIEIVTDVVAEGDVYDINGAITVTYEGDKPAVEQAIKEIMENYLPGKGLHDIKMVNVWNNVYYFEGTDIYGNVHSYTWNSVRDFVPGVDVTVNDVTKTVAYDASLTEAFTVAGDTIEGYVLNGETPITGDADDTLIAAPYTYTDRNIKAGNFYGQADEEVPAAMLNNTNDESQVEIDGKYVPVDGLKFGALEKIGDNWNAKVPDSFAWLIVVDGENRYLAHGDTFEVSDYVTPKSDYVLVESSDTIFNATNTFTATDDETYTTGYLYVNITGTDIANIDGAVVAWTNQDGEELKLTDSSYGGTPNMFIKQGDSLVATVTLRSGLNAADTDYIEITGADVVVTGIANASYSETNGKVSFVEANINEGAELVFTLTGITNGQVVTLDIQH